MHTFLLAKYIIQINLIFPVECHHFWSTAPITRNFTSYLAWLMLVVVNGFLDNMRASASLTSVHTIKIWSRLNERPLKITWRIIVILFAFLILHHTQTKYLLIFIHSWRLTSWLSRFLQICQQINSADQLFSPRPLWEAKSVRSHSHCIACICFTYCINYVLLYPCSSL